MKHALIINHNAGSPYHGPNFRSYYAARGWVEHGIRATIVCSSFSHKLKKLPEVDGEYSTEKIDGIRYIWIKTTSYSNNFGRMLSYLKFFRRLNILDNIIDKPVDHVICSSPPPFWIQFCHRFARKNGSSLIFEARDLWPDVIFETSRFGILNPAAWMMRIAEVFAYKNADRVVSVNESAIKVMEKRGLDPSKFCAIPNGAYTRVGDDNGASPEAAKLCTRLKKKGMFVVGYAGALSRIYGLAYLAEAARILRRKPIAFVLAGNGDFESELKKLETELPNLFLVGWVPKWELNAYLKSVDLCFAGLLDLPSFAYGSDSTKIYEYMKASRAVLHSIGDKDSVVAVAKCGIRIAPQDSKAIAKGITEFQCYSPEDLDLMGKRGFEYLKKNRSYDVLNRKWVKLFDEIDKARVK